MGKKQTNMIFYLNLQKKGEKRGKKTLDLNWKWNKREESLGNIPIRGLVIAWEGRGAFVCLLECCVDCGEEK